MPLFMDIHHVPAPIDLEGVADAHAADLRTQAAHSVDYQRYWVDPVGGRIFCLVEAPDAEAAARVHQQAHGLVANEIHEVVEGK